MTFTDPPYFTGYKFDEDEEPYMPEYVYHYTDATGCLAILDSGIFRASSLATMNDRSEYQYALKAFNEYGSKRCRVEVGDDPDISKVVDYNRFHESVSAVWDSGRYIFALSTSEVDRDLSQWRAYGGNSGMCIKLSTNSKPGLGVIGVDGLGVDNIPGSWEQVTYSVVAAEEKFAKLYTMIVDHSFSPEEIELDVQMVLSTIKAPEFHSEREYRYVVCWQISEGPHPAVQHRVGRFGITPYFNLGFVDPYEPAQPVEVGVSQVSVGATPGDGSMINYWGRPVQGVGATVPAIVAAGVAYPRVFRGRVLSLAAMVSRSRWV